MYDKNKIKFFTIYFKTVLFCGNIWTKNIDMNNGN